MLLLLLTVSLKSELVPFCVRCGQAGRSIYCPTNYDLQNRVMDPVSDPSWVISELRDIISTGFNGMRTINSRTSSPTITSFGLRIFRFLR